MKRKNSKIYLPVGLAIIGLVFACNKSFLEKAPIGSYTPDVIATKSGVSGLLIGAYSLLDGQGGAGGSWDAAASNWVWGGVCSDDAHKGSDPGDQPDINSLMTWSETSTNDYNLEKWRTCYDGIQRSNDVLRAMPNLHIPAGGELTVEVLNASITLEKGKPNSVFDTDGSAIVIHGA